MQMMDLPADNEGLTWIVSQDATQLLLIPGLQPASVAVAAAGDQQALAYLRFTARHHAAYPGICALSPLDRACREASDVKSRQGYKGFDTALAEEQPRVASVFRARQTHTLDQLVKAASTGQLAALQWMQAICPQTWSIRRCNLGLPAAKAGHLTILKHLWVKHLRSGTNPDDWGYDTMSALAAHLDCFKWLVSADVQEGSSLCWDSALASVAVHHGLAALQWCRSHAKLSKDVWGEPIVEKAARMGDQAMLEWLRAQDPPVPWSDWTCTAAAARGDISMLKWLRGQEPPCPWDSHVTAAAACKDLETLQWLRAQQPPCPWDSFTFAEAARAGKLEVLIWLRAQEPPCPWSSRSFEAAAYQPNADMLTWLHEAGCPPELCTFKLSKPATRGGHLAILQWLCDRGHVLTGDLYQHAAARGLSHVLRFLHRMKVSPPDSNSPLRGYSRFQAPMAMFLADIGAQLPEVTKQAVTRARRAHCAFHGLVRWWKQALTDPSRDAHLAFDSLADDRSGQMLLTRLSLLPSELICKIAVAAELQHDIFEAS